MEGVSVTFVRFQGPVSKYYTGGCLIKDSGTIG